MRLLRDTPPLSENTLGAVFNFYLFSTIFSFLDKLYLFPSLSIHIFRTKVKSFVTKKKHVKMQEWNPLSPKENIWY